MSDLPEGLSWRRARVEDAAAIAALMAAVDEGEGLEPWVTETDVREDLEDPDLDLDSDTWVVEDSGRLVGYSELWDARQQGAEALQARGWTAPSHLGRGIGTFFLDRTEEAATKAAELLLRETFARFKAKGWNKVGLGVDSSNATGAVRLYERVGMHITRQFDAYERVIAP